MVDDALVFKTAIKSELDKPAPIGPDITITIDDEEVTFHAPTSAQYALMLTGIQGSTPEAVAAMINFFFFLLKDEGQHRRFKQRLWHAEDPFDEVVVAQIGKALIQQWSGHPTKSASGSSSSAGPSGRLSTEQPQQPVSTPSAFGPTAS
jgi:hypothetical protein